MADRILHSDEYTELVATDEQDESGASHNYQVRTIPPKPKRKRRTKKEIEEGEDSAEEEATPESQVLSETRFQKGGRKENPLNGMTDEDAARILIDRMEGFENGQFPSKYTTMAKAYFEKGLQWLTDRKKEREARGVEGKTEA